MQVVHVKRVYVLSHFLLFTFEAFLDFGFITIAAQNLVAWHIDVEYKSCSSFETNSIFSN